MRLSDSLSAFSVDDLRELASRRGVLLSQSVLQDRQTLVRTLASTLGQYDNVYSTITQLNQAELAVLKYLLQDGKRGGLSALCAASGASEATVKGVLEGLRLWGLLFPEGSWQHIAIPGATQLAANYLGPRSGWKPQEALELTPPALAPAAGAERTPRPGTFGWDLAELLARVARARFKLTQAGRMNRRDLRAMEPAFGVTVSGYATFLSQMAAGLRLLGVANEGLLVALEETDGWLAQETVTRAAAAALAWQALRGYPESVNDDPAESQYYPALLSRQRSRLLEMVRTLGPDESATVASLAKRLAWMAPLSFQQWDGSRDAERVTSRMVRSLYWLGLAAVDDPDVPTAFQWSPLGARALALPGAEAAPLVPEETQFFVQPNAEVFAPPNLAPRTYFHLRRITGEKKGGPAGMFPLTADSLRRALDSGATVPQITAFLERFSRTGLPTNVRELVATTGRQHGRIRLVPASYVLVTDEPGLLKELRNVKTVASLVGAPLTERAALVDEAQVGELLRRLRTRGYAPLNQAEAGMGPALPDDPESAPPPPASPVLGRAAPNLDWAGVGEASAEPVAVSGPTVTGVAPIRALLEDAERRKMAVEIEYVSSSSPVPVVSTIWPYYVAESIVEAYCCTRQAERGFKLARIAWARLTGESFAGEHV
jgi:hypothetical protein